MTYDHMRAPLRLPQVCPVAGCGVLLQRSLTPRAGVRPHFEYCHRDLPVPSVIAGDTP